MQQPRNSKAALAVDTISGLPDTILSHILSLLPTKEAVATSILSKRWIHLWHFVDGIDFPDTITVNSIESTYSFNQFMYSVLVSRYAAGSHSTNHFCLEIQYGSPNLAYRLGFPHVIKWINLIVQPGLKYLRLRLHVYCLNDDDDDDQEYDLLPKLPISVLNCTTLVSLDLARFRVKGFSFSSVGFGFPSLNELHLNKIVFDEVRDFMLILAGCPILEYLRAEHIYFYCDEDPLATQVFKTLSLPKLISADITRYWCSCFPVKALSNSEYLCVETSMLCTKDHEIYEVNQPQCPCYNIPVFHNLTHLELHGSLELVAQVLQHCPKLQNLELYEEEHEEHEEDGQENWVEPEAVPQCLSSCLTSCTIHNFSGIQSELIIAKYILKNARNLQIMEIWSRTDNQSEIERKLSTSPKASATCQLFIY